MDKPSASSLIAPALRGLRTAQEKTAERADRIDEPIQAALAQCVEARALIGPEQEKIRALIEAAESDIERDFRCYQHDLVAWQLERAAEIAHERLALFASLKSADDYARERARCADGPQGTLYWFRMYAWGYDPRPDSPLQVMPFVPFKFQEEYLQWLEELVFLERASGLVEKSRDMGATATAVNWCVKQWLFRQDFSMMLLSTDEDLVDSKKDTDTLFEKARFQLRLTPTWMRPTGFNLQRDMPHMNIANPENGSVMTGEAPTENVGRQRRRSFVLLDEFATWRFGGYPQHTSLSQTTRSMLKLATPLGKHNKYAEERFSGQANVFVMDWREHPWKDEHWYQALPFGYGGPPMSQEAIAQEIDRDYEASQPGRVWPLYHEAYTVITVSELRAFFKGHNILLADDGDGRARVPREGYTGRANDRGATAGHRNAWLWGWRPKEGWPLADSVFIFREWQVPLGASFREIAETVKAFEAADREGDPKRMVLSLNSHEAQSERDNYAKEHGLYLRGWKTDYEAGIAQVTEFLTVIDKHRPHPFRPELLGRTRLLLVVADGEGELRRRENGSFYATPARTSGGLLNLRRQIAGYHYPPEEAGKPVGMMRPRKIDDDFVDDLRAFAINWGGLNAPVSRAERLEQEIPENLRLEKIEQEVAAGIRNPTGAYHARQHALVKAERRLAAKRPQSYSALAQYRETLRKGR